MGEVMSVIEKWMRKDQKENFEFFKNMESSLNEISEQQDTMFSLFHNVAKKIIELEKRIEKLEEKK